jgi:epoxyqueuosine reductase
MTESQSVLTNRIKRLARDLGFSACGVAPAGELTEDAVRLKNWLKNSMHADMQYMSNHFDLRTNPSKLVPGAKSAIVVLMNYYPRTIQQEQDNLIISKYAYGKDYHKVMKRMLKHLQRTIEKEIAPLKGRVFVDSAPVLERALAAAAGLGWIGKNAQLISPREGSFVFIGELISDLELHYDKSLPDYCGGCSRCIQACPTGAIVEDRVIDSRKCISYWTIENKKSEMDNSLKGKFMNRIFGCDICQDVCPWNKKVKPTNTEELHPSPDLISMTYSGWIQLTRDGFDSLFQGSAVKRAGYEGLMRNIRFITG